MILILMEILITTVGIVQPFSIRGDLDHVSINTY
jgi:hypothetical protein